MRYNIGVVTTTRADYGILTPLLSRMASDNDIALYIIVGGTHLSNRFGYTISQIKHDNFGEIITFDYLSDETSVQGVCKSASKALFCFSELLNKYSFDMIVILGDRYEMLCVAEAACIYHIPIIHLHGGEITEGAIDDNIRHAITKLSTLHFAANEIYRKRIIQMGETPDRVFNSGALGIELINKLKLIPEELLYKELNISKPYILMTYHPETNNIELNPIDEILTVLNSMIELNEFDYIVTKANADQGGDEINNILIDFARKYNNIHLFDSLGSLKYLSAMKYSIAIIGNSSSGIIEAPSLCVPTVDIGNRQKGRMRADSVVNVSLDKDEIISAIIKVSDEKNRNSFDYTNPYGDGNASQIICREMKRYLNNPNKFSKNFYDIV